jgi:hypothetical protein
LGLRIFNIQKLDPTHRDISDHFHPLPTSNQVTTGSGTFSRSGSYE